MSSVHIFFSVHERLFGAIAQVLLSDGSITSLSGFAWGLDQERRLGDANVPLSRLTVFTRDLLGSLDEKPTDFDYLRGWESQCGVNLHHMIFAERHLVHRLNYRRLTRLAELIFRRVEKDFDDLQPELYLSEDVSCLTSYIHWAVARARGIRIAFVNNARFRGRVVCYGNPLQRWNALEDVFPETPPGYLKSHDVEDAQRYIDSFRSSPVPPSGTHFRNKLRVAEQYDFQRLLDLSRRWVADPNNPTLELPLKAVARRARRLLRTKRAELAGLYEHPTPEERFVLFPLHLQPEATTLVLAPYYLDQAALIEDIAKSLPIGVRLYVKEHMVSRGRWPLGFYRRLVKTPGVVLIHPEENAFELVRRSQGVATIAGTMGWEALLLAKPVATFGDVFYNCYPHVRQAGCLAKRDWPTMFADLLSTNHVLDDALLRRFVACAWRSTYPGFMGNPSSFPAVMESRNVSRLADVVRSQLLSFGSTGGDDQIAEFTHGAPPTALG